MAKPKPRKPAKPAPPILPVAGRPAVYNSRAPRADRRPVHIPDLGEHAAGCLDRLRAAMAAGMGVEAGKVPVSDVVRLALSTTAWIAGTWSEQDTRMAAGAIRAKAKGGPGE